MIQITEQQMMDYIKCPVLYDIKYNSAIKIHDEPDSLSYMLGKMAKYFYFHMLNGKICSMAELKSKWDSLCHQYNSMDPKKNLEGLAMISKMLLWAQREQLTVLDIETKYSIHTKTVELSGNLPAIISPKDGQYEILITDFSSRLPDIPIVNLKLQYTLGCYGFKCAYNRDPIGIRVHNVKHGRDLKTIRNDNDYKRLRTAIEHVGQSIEKGLYYPRELNCHKCPGYDYCRHWHK